MNDAAESGQRGREQLEKILASQTFQGAVRSQQLLRFLVDAASQNRTDRLKEYTLGVEALGRGEAFDPRTDPIVRAEASRLRSRLDKYLRDGGSGGHGPSQAAQGHVCPSVRGAVNQDE